MTEFYIGIDLGATKAESALIDSLGKVHDRVVMPTKSAEAEAVVQDLAQMIQTLKLRTQHSISGIGIGVAGQVEAESGVVYFAPNLKWRNFPLKQRIQELCQLECSVANDVRVATLGEWYFGAGKGSSNFLCLFVGSGIGGGAVCGGKLLTGHSNSACEFGHIVIDLNGPFCLCGSKGCFEALAGGWGIARRAQEMIKANPLAGQQMLAIVKRTSETLTAKDVFHANQLGDPLALELVEKVKKSLIAGICSLVNAFNPERIILGGGLIENNPDLLKSIEENLPKNTLEIAAKGLRITSALLKEDAGVIGASVLLHQEKI